MIRFGYALAAVLASAAFVEFCMYVRPPIGGLLGLLIYSIPAFPAAWLWKRVIDAGKADQLHR